MSLETTLKDIIKSALYEYNNAQEPTEVVDNTVPKKFIATITQNGVSAPTIEVLLNTTGITTPVLSTSYLAVGRYNIALDYTVHNLINQNKGVLNLGTPTPQTTTNFQEKTIYTQYRDMTNNLEIRTNYHGGGTNDSFILSDNQIKKVKFEIELFE